MFTIKSYLLSAIAITLVGSALVAGSDEPSRVRSAALGQVPQAFARFAKALRHSKSTNRYAKMKIKRVPDRRAQEALVANLQPIQDPTAALSAFINPALLDSEIEPAFKDLEKAMANSLNRAGIRAFRNQNGETQTDEIILTDGMMGEILVLSLNEQA